MEKIEKAIEGTSESLSRLDLRKKGVRLRKSGKKRYVLFTVDDGTGRTLEGIKKIGSNTTFIEVGKEDAFPFDITKSVYSSKLKVYYIVDINEGQLHLDLGDTFKFSPKLLKKIVKGQAISQTLTRWTNQQSKMNFLVGVFFMAFGGILGYLIALYVSGVL